LVPILPRRRLGALARTGIRGRPQDAGRQEDVIDMRVGAVSNDRGGGIKMFRRKRVSPPSTPFAHGPDCRIFAADPGVDIPWNDLGGGAWRRECVCSFEIFNAPFVDNRTRLDPYDPATARHLPQCEYIGEASPLCSRSCSRSSPAWAKAITG
jgi:hypothetical protein